MKLVLLIALVQWKPTSTANTTGNYNIYIGDKLGIDSSFGITQGGNRQLNIGNLILGGLRTSLPPSPLSRPSAGALINGTLESAKRLTVHDGGLLVKLGGLTVEDGGLADLQTRWIEGIRRWTN